MLERVENQHNTRELTTNPLPLKEFPPGFFVRDLIVPLQKNPAASRRFFFSKNFPACGGDSLLSKDLYFITDFHYFCLEKAQHFPATSRLGLLFPPKIRVLLFLSFLEKIGPGFSWREGGVLMLSFW